MVQEMVKANLGAEDRHRRRSEEGVPVARVLHLAGARASVSCRHPGSRPARGHLHRGDGVRPGSDGTGPSLHGPLPAQSLLHRPRGRPRRPVRSAEVWRVGGPQSGGAGRRSPSRDADGDLGPGRHRQDPDGGRVRVPPRSGGGGETGDISTTTGLHELFFKALSEANSPTASTFSMASQRRSSSPPPARSSIPSTTRSRPSGCPAPTPPSSRGSGSASTPRPAAWSADRAGRTPRCAGGPDRISFSDDCRSAPRLGCCSPPIRNCSDQLRDGPMPVRGDVQAACFPFSRRRAD